MSGEKTTRRQAYVELARERGFHTEQIKCPKCQQKQSAMVEHTRPWYTFIHTCTRCNYIISESEWEPT